MNSQLLPALQSVTVEGTAYTAFPFLQEGDVYGASWVPEHHIPRFHREYVRRRVDRAAKAAGLGQIRVRWFGPPINGGDFRLPSAPFDGALFGGVAPDGQPMTIALNADIRGEAVDWVIAHEVGHVAQRLRPDAPPSGELAERDADRFTLTYMLGAGDGR